MEVLKFGSSVLGDDQDYVTAVHEIYRRVRTGERVIAVVSAAKGVTDSLYAQARRSWGRPAAEPLAAWITAGEWSSAARLRLALDRVGVPSRAVSPWQCRLVCDGPTDDATPWSLDTVSLRRALDHDPVVVVPGFAGIQRETEDLCLLGRGGSDLSAVFLAAELDAACVLFKGVDRLYERDPEQDPQARRFETVTWETAHRVAGRAVQPKALDLAARRGVPLSIRRVADFRSTRFGADATIAHPPRRHAPIRVGLIGFGTVGQGVYALLQHLSHAFRIERVLTRRSRSEVPTCTTDAEDFFASPWSICVDTCSDPIFALGFARRVLASDRAYVTASKELAGRQARALEACACGPGAFRYSAAVGGGMPALETVLSVAKTEQINCLEATLNGTANYVLHELTTQPFAKALERAGNAGLSEADPEDDLSGLDAARKLAILVRELWGVSLDERRIPRDRIDASTVDRIARAGVVGRVRQVARASRSEVGVRAEVRLVALPQESALLPNRRLDGVHGDENVLVLTLAGGRAVVTRGRGAGRWPTAESMLSDLIDLQHTWAEERGEAADFATAVLK